MTDDKIGDKLTDGSGANAVRSIVIDLDGDGNELLNAGETNAAFDMDGDGKPDDTSWFGSGDAILFLDRDGNGMVTDAKEFSFVQDVENARSGLDGLRAFDSNKDGKLSAADEKFAQFRLWQDRNGDGVAAAGEITTLAASSLASLSLVGTPTSLPAAAGSAVAINTGHYTRPDGSQGMVSDAALSYYSGATGAKAQIDLARQSFGRKAGKYQILAQGGQLFVTLRKAKGELDPGSGRIGPATLLSFSNKTIGMLAPIILDLDGDGIEMVARGKSKAQFDMDGDGSRDDTGWVGKGDGFLVIDRDDDGLITGAAELSFLTEKPGARSDLEALAALDSNRDRKIDATDLRFGELKVWVDANRNGLTDAGELRTLQELSIASIDLAGSATRQSVRPGQNVLLATGNFTLTDGTVRSLGDAALAFRPSGSGSTLAGASGGLSGGVLDRLLPRLPEGLREDRDPDPGPAPELTQSLRAGLGDHRLSVGTSGLSFDLPPDSDPFEVFAAAAAGPERRQGRQDMPAMLAPAADDDPAPSGADMHSVDDLRLGLMVQQMAGFGRAAGENELNQRGRSGDYRYDYFA